MAKVTPITEQYQHFVEDLQETFWGDVEARTQRFFDRLSETQRDQYMVCAGTVAQPSDRTTATVIRNGIS